MIIDRLHLAAGLLPAEGAISSLTLAELATGPHANDDPRERALRQLRLQQVEATFDVLPFDSAAARAYGRIYAAIRGAGRRPRGRIVDLQIAAVALAHAIPLFTRDPDDFRGLEGIVDVVPV